MNQQYLNKLEYNKILEKLSSYSHTYIGKELISKLIPSNDKDIVLKWLKETSEAVSLIERNGTPPISSIANIELYIKLLDSSNTLSAKALLDIVNILEIASDLKEYFSRFIDDVHYENLYTYFSTLYTNKSISTKIRSSILDENTISDNASHTLSTIRRKQHNLESDIKDKLNTILHSSTYSKYMQENIVTVRNDRYVIPVKSEYRSQVKGFIHDMSSSGSTVFIEPLPIFDLNNELNNLKNEEQTEIEKILQILSSLLFEHTNELKINIQTIGKLDFIFAKAKYSKVIDAITPNVNSEKHINLINARHPLIDPLKVVPSNISLGQEFSLLIITGPNTGGKTVTLKTVGLLSCMACSGLNIPASEGSSVYVFDEIFADIGDDQSISDSLSTFSSHMINIANIVNTATSESLILVDELGSGTDPLEGANLAISILEYFKSKNILTLATTHYQELKRYALVTIGAQNASVEFDIEKLKPTYKLLLGIPGKSNAFAISEKLGLKKEIIEKASSMLSKQDFDIETLLKNIYDSKIQLEKEKEELEKNLNQITLLKKNLQRDNLILEKQEKELINNAKIKARDILLEAKEEANSLINNMRKIENASESIAELNKLRNLLNESIKNTSITNSNLEKKLELTPIDKKLLIPGIEVYVPHFGQNAIVLSNISKSNEVQVQIGSIKTKVNIKYLELCKNHKESNNNSNFNYNNKTKEINNHVHVIKTKNVNSELNVIGLTVNEAIPLVDKFIDDCFLAKLQNARIVHGKGTGKLRQAIQSHLKNHSHIKSYRIGTYGEGEMGVTIIEII